jgi:hypothetical protein
MSANPRAIALMIAQSSPTPFLYSGMVIRVSSLCVRPRMTLSERVLVTQEFRDEMNAWMLEFFGTEDCVFFFRDPTTGKKTCVLSPGAAEILRKSPKPSLDRFGVIL